MLIAGLPVAIVNKPRADKLVRLLPLRGRAFAASKPGADRREVAELPRPEDQSRGKQTPLTMLCYCGAPWSLY